MFSMIKGKINKKRLVVLIVLISAFFLLSKLIYKRSLVEENENNTQLFFNEEKTVFKIEAPIYDSPPIKKEETKKENYIALLEIPSISLTQGFYAKNSKLNNVDKNIQILKKSDMPDKKNGNTILASHSGNCSVCYFKNLYKIKEKDLINIYHKDIKFTYQVVKKYLEEKDGDIWIKKDNNKTTLTLTTCSQQEKGKQIVIIANLIKQENY